MPEKLKYPFERMDNDDNVFFSRQLEVIREKTADVKYPTLKGSMFVPVNTNVSDAAQEYTFRIYDQRGMAKLVTDYARDWPAVDISGEEVTVKIKSIGDSYNFSLQEIRGARMSGVPLDQKKASAAKRAIDEKHDNILQDGDDLPNGYGLLNQPNATSYVIPNGISGSPLWANKTSDEIAADIFGIVTNCVTLTKEVEIPNMIILPLASFLLISTKRMGDMADGKTILAHVKENLEKAGYPCEIMPWYACDTAGSGGAKRMVAYRRDPDCVEAIVPVTFEQFPPQQEGLVYKTLCHGRTAGVVAYYPLSINYADGI
jgi:hypothetical protein